MQPQRQFKHVVISALLGVTVLSGCTAKQAEAPIGYEAAATQAANAASRAAQAAQRAETAAAKAESAGQRAEQAVQRVEAAALALEERFTKRMRK